jgi:ubiquitin carboxyl-terminal hydrolase 4/11
LSFAEDGSSVASSPSGAYADLTINSDRGADTPASDLAHSHRGSSPFAKTTYHRAIMGGAADFPERSSSPLKRRASSMETEKPAPPQDGNNGNDGKEDVDMVSAPPPDIGAMETGAAERRLSSQTDAFMGSQTTSYNGMQNTSMVENTTPGT